MNILSIDNYRAVVTYDPDTDMLARRIPWPQRRRRLLRERHPHAQDRGSQVLGRIPRRLPRETVSIRCAISPAASMPASIPSFMHVLLQRRRLRALASTNSSNALSNTKCAPERCFGRTRPVTRYPLRTLRGPVNEARAVSASTLTAR